MPKKVQLFIIDPQMDFCDPKTGSLYVKGAENDMSRLAKMIRDNIDRIDKIHVTLDSHHKVHIANPIFWVDSNNNHPKPSTIISSDDLTKGRYRAFKPALKAADGRTMQEIAINYVNQLEKTGRFQLIIWPEHCLIGSLGYSIVPELYDALLEWESQFITVRKVTKGSNPFTEHYSAVRAEVVDSRDPTTMLNTDLIKTLQQADEILIAGEALSHCVANTIQDVANEFSEDEVKKFTLLEDATSSVVLPDISFEQQGQDFINELRVKGMQTTDTENAFKTRSTTLAKK